MASDPAVHIEFPVLALRDTVVFPNLVTPLLIGREESKESVRLCARDDTPLVMVAQRDPSEDEPSSKGLYRVGVAGKILQVMSLPDGSLKILVEAVQRIRIKRFVWRNSCRKARIEELGDVLPLQGDSSAKMRGEASARIVTELFERYALLNPVVPEGVPAALQEIGDAGQVADTVAAHIAVRTSSKQKLLELLEPERRLHELAKVLQKEVEILEYQKTLDNKIRDHIQKSQKEFYLREQLKVLREELDEEGAQGISALENRIKESGMPEYACKAARRELDRLSQSQLHSPQAAVSMEYIETMLSLPWAKSATEDIDVTQARKVLDRDHYGLEDVKDRVLDYLAVRKLAPQQKGQILCFVGPPGVGKTSIAHSIAEALGRKFVKKSLGGVRDEAEIRGHRRTYVAAMPGGIIKGMIKAGSKNPLFLLDEIDKLSRDFHGDPGAALLEVLDPKENQAFIDHYMEIEFDLSNVFFVATANWQENIPAVLRDRMEIIRFSGYTPIEKIEIAKRHLLPAVREEHGLAAGDIEIGTETIGEVVACYTHEAGVRDLRRRMATLCRKVARKMAEGKKGKTKISPADLPELLGPPPFFREKLDDCGPGTATGLAWTETGGTVMPIEVSFMPGKGRISLTGSLGNVMQESARAALTFVRSNSAELKIKCDEPADVHVHVPEGATPKDGPSAGVAMLAALVSAYRNRAIDPHIAFTGEITLRGRVLPVGGIKEKLLAAHRDGVRKVIMPERNRADLARVPSEIIDKLEIAFVSWAKQVIDECGLNG